MLTTGGRITPPRFEYEDSTVAERPPKNEEMRVGARQDGHVAVRPRKLPIPDTAAPVAQECHAVLLMKYMVSTKVAETRVESITENTISNG